MPVWFEALSGGLITLQIMAVHTFPCQQPACKTAEHILEWYLNSGKSVDYFSIMLTIQGIKYLITVHCNKNPLCIFGVSGKSREVFLYLPCDKLTVHGLWDGQAQHQHQHRGVVGVVNVVAELLLFVVLPFPLQCSFCYDEVQTLETQLEHVCKKFNAKIKMQGEKIRANKQKQIHTVNMVESIDRSVKDKLMVRSKVSQRITGEFK